MLRIVSRFMVIPQLRSVLKTVSHVATKGHMEFGVWTNESQDVHWTELLPGAMSRLTFQLQLGSVLKPVAQGCH